MDDDLNTPRAVAELFEAVNHGHRLLESGDAAGAAQVRGLYDVLLKCGTALGLFLQGMAEESPEQLQQIQAVIAERDAARRAKDFARADAIRARLGEEGILLSDTSNGTFWRRQ